MSPKLYLTRHGQSVYNTTDRIGGDSGLSNNGKDYALQLYKYFEDKDIEVFTSKMNRTIETSKYFDESIIQRFEFLNEIDSGIYDGYTYQQIKEESLDEYNKRKSDKYNYRYPEGESYHDLKQRVEEIFNFLKNNNNDKLIICHTAVIRVIYGIIFHIPNKDIPYIDVPLNTLFEINQDKLTINKIKIQAS